MIRQIHASMSRDQSPERTDRTPDESSETADSPVTRRRLVAASAATWASVSLAGCTYITDPGVDSDDGPTVTNETTTTGNTTNESTGNESGDEASGGESSGDDCASIGRFSAGMEVGLHVGI